jgi:hypothetical protein
MPRPTAADPRPEKLKEVNRLANVAIFGTLSESYRTCGHEGCRCHGDGPKHGPHLHISYRGAEGKTTGYYVPKAAQPSIRAGVEAWSRMMATLREVAELNRQAALQAARADTNAGRQGGLFRRPTRRRDRARRPAGTRRPR